VFNSIYHSYLLALYFDYINIYVYIAFYNIFTNLCYTKYVNESLKYIIYLIFMTIVTNKIHNKHFNTTLILNKCISINKLWSIFFWRVLHVNHVKKNMLTPKCSNGLAPNELYKELTCYCTKVTLFNKINQ
jgi:hypothetical protein